MAPKAKKPVAEEQGLSELLNRFKAHPFLFTGTILVLVIVIVAFVFVPAMPGVGGGEAGNLVFGYYNGKPIAHAYNNYFDRSLRDLASYMGFDLQSDYSRNQGAAYQVWYAAFMRTLIRIAVLDEMNRSGYTVPPKEIDRLVAALPDFQEEGRFSIVKYNNYDKNRMLSLWNAMEGDFIYQKYMEDISSLQVSSAEKAFIGNMASPERVFDMATFPRSAYPDSELSAYAEANPALFQMTHLYRITLASEKEARQVLDSVQSGKSTFEDAARNHSVDADKDKGGDMGLRMAHEMYTAIAEEADREAVLSLKKGEMSPIIKAPEDRWTFFRAEETPYAADLSQGENLSKIRSYMNQFEGGLMESWLIARVDEFVAEAQRQNASLSAYIESLKERNDEENPLFALIAAAATGAIGPTNLNYGNLGGSSMEGGLRLFPNTLDSAVRPELGNAVTNEYFWQNAFSTPLNVPSKPFTLGETIVVLTATEEIVQDETSIENITSFYTMGWMMNITETELNSIVLNSEKLENQFFEVFYPLLTPPPPPPEPPTAAEE